MEQPDPIEIIITHAHESVRGNMTIINSLGREESIAVTSRRNGTPIVPQLQELALDIYDVDLWEYNFRVTHVHQGEDEQ